MQNTLKSKTHLLKESFYAILVLEAGKKAWTVRLKTGS